jgi:hypothetical protein
MNDHIEHPIAKFLALVWAFLTLHWPQVFDVLTGLGKFCAAITAITICAEWFWKKVVMRIWQ